MPVTSALLLTLGAAVAYALFRLRRRACGEAAVNTLVVFGAFALVYLVFITVVKSLIYVDNGDRHYLPAYVPLLFIAALGMDRLLGYGRNGRLPGVSGWLPALRTFVRGGGGGYFTRS